MTLTVTFITQTCLDTKYIERYTVAMTTTTVMKQKQTERQELLGCVHEWETYRQTIQATNDKFHGSAYFIVKGCPKCHKKHYLDYVVDRT